jgi:bacterioferritin-associated ferredoxin
MIVCHCAAVNDRAIRLAHDAGARTIGQMSRACGAARSCGGCRPALADLLAALRDDVSLACAPVGLGSRADVAA